MIARRAILLISILHLGGALAPTEAGNALTDAIDRALGRIARAQVDPLATAPTAQEAADLETREHLAIARSIRAIEAGVDSTNSVLDAEVLPLLSLARHHRHLGMRERALVWFDRADLADHRGEFVDVVEHERAECLAEIGDSTRIFLAIDDLLSRDNPQTWTHAMEPLLQAALSFPTAVELKRQLAEIDALAAPVDLQLLWRVGQLRMLRDEWQPARNTFGRLILSEDDLTLDVAARALKGLADASLLLEEYERATDLYRRYRAANAGRLSAWSTYQLGALAALDGDHRKAADLFRSVCERPEATDWSEQACTRLRLTRELLAKRGGSASKTGDAK